jgi:hypothetical protein
MRERERERERERVKIYNKWNFTLYEAKGKKSFATLVDMQTPLGQIW